MKFSLKALLLAMCGVGATIGVMGKLLLESPETFLNVLRLGSTLGPFLLAVGTIIWVGMRGAPRRRGLIVWGFVLLLAPFVILGGMAFLLPTGNALQLLSTSRLISQRIPVEADSPWVWQELERRLDKGKLNSQQVDAALSEFVAYMTKTKPAGWNQPLSWQRSFLTKALLTQSVSQETLLRLCDAFYGPKPVVKPIPPVRNGARNFGLAVSYGNRWAAHSGLDVALVWSIKQVLIDQKPISVTQVSKFADDWDATCEASLEPGMHEVSVVVEAAYVDTGGQAGMMVGGTSLDQLPPEKWPKARKRWTTTVTAPFNVEPASSE